MLFKQLPNEMGAVSYQGTRGNGQELFMVDSSQSIARLKLDSRHRMNVLIAGVDADGDKIEEPFILALPLLKSLPKK